MPEGSQFTLDASAANGEVVANVAGFTTTQTGPLRVTGTMGGGGSTVNLSADGGNVELRSAAAVTSENRAALDVLFARRERSSRAHFRASRFFLAPAAAVPVDSLSSRETTDA